jgi:hypothetical protein
MAMATAEPTWQPYEVHGDLTTRSNLPEEAAQKAAATRRREREAQEDRGQA